MSATATAPRWSAVPPLAWARSRAAGWRDPALVVAVGVLCLVFMAGPLMPDASRRNWTVPAVYNILQFGLPWVLGMRLADAAVTLGARPWPLYTAVGLGVPAAGVWLFGPLLAPLLGTDPGWRLINDLWLQSGITVLLGLGTAVVAHWRVGELAQQRFRDAEAQRLQREQQLHAARLLALQARVEPALLFTVLHAVRARAEHDGPGAEALLADLIALLRSLLPAARARHSTLGRELALVQAQAQVLAAAGAGPGAGAAQALPPLHGEPGAAALEAEFSPLVLPGLLRLLAGLHPGGHWRLTAPAAVPETAEAPLVLDVELADAPPQADSPAADLGTADVAARVQALVEQLRSVHGPTATLELRPGRAGPAALISIPWRAAPAAPAEPFQP